MKALVKTAKGYDNMVVRDEAEPEITRDDLVKIKIAYSGICGTDLHTFKGMYKKSEPPLILGHEFSGVVVEVGSKVTKVKVGDRVTSETTFETCCECEFCETKHYNLCLTRKGLGTQINGSFTEFIVSREESVHKLPDNVSLLSAALCEPLSCVTHACLEQTTIEAGETVVVFGPGAIGLLTCMVAKAKGATVILAGTSKDATRFELAKTLDIDRIVDQNAEDLVEVVMGMTNGAGANKIFECSGVIHALNKAFEIIKIRGEIVQVGVFTEEINTVNLGYFFSKEIKYAGSRSQKPSAWHLTLDLLGKGLLEPEKIVTMVTDLDNWREAFEKSIDCSEVKVVFKCGDVDE